MKLIFNGQEYTFWFSYGIINILDGLEPLPEPKRKDCVDDLDFHLEHRAWSHAHREYADCCIRIGEVREDQLFDVAARVIRYVADPPNRKKAREAALEKALKELTEKFPVPSFTAREGHLLDADRRQKFWFAYETNCRASWSKQKMRQTSKVA